MLIANMHAPYLRILSLHVVASARIKSLTSGVETDVISDIIFHGLIRYSAQ